MRVRGGKNKGHKIYTCDEINLYWGNAEVINPKGHVLPKVKHPQETS
jgi:hypothetical protein